ncbi:MAG TPA: glucose-6-phosphate dehydrogenase [Candidatus Methylacidiphilales bacterium]|nr:glucose-6-phosphate dehydrogenase [Candidatus Methylacidiphilales bacterium]
MTLDPVVDGPSGAVAGDLKLGSYPELSASALPYFHYTRTVTMTCQEIDQRPPAITSSIAVKPIAAVIFGATGDLTHRKIVPAFYHLAKNGLLPEGSTIIGFARRPKTDAEFREDLKVALEQFSHTKPIDYDVWDKLSQHIYYHQGDLPDLDSYRSLAERLKSLPEAELVKGNYLFYLATAPNFFGDVATNLAEVGLARGENDSQVRRLIVEKPFGEDLKSAKALNTTLQKAFPEKNIYRIDHYLGKETVQNLMYFRFANTIFEPLWNRRYIDHVQITVAEKVGVMGRGGYYDAAGASRDMLQNHMLQLFTLIAMEPPASLDAESIRDEKVKVLRSIPTPKLDELVKNSVRAQYGGGFIDGKAIPAYRQEDRVAQTSLTETFVALRLEIDNWRWQGVPFYLRTGKALTKQYTEISITFNRPPSVLFAGSGDERLHRNNLRIRIQPNEGITLNFNAKKPAKAEAHSVGMNFRYKQDFTDYLPEAYERLIVDALTGESTLFTRSDEVEQAWRLVDTLHSAWDSQQSTNLPLYSAGSMGPFESELLLQREGRRWASVPTDI